jgi:hypothetical protein
MKLYKCILLQFVCQVMFLSRCLPHIAFGVWQPDGPLSSYQTHLPESLHNFVLRGLCSGGLQQRSF